MAIHFAPAGRLPARRNQPTPRQETRPGGERCAGRHSANPPRRGRCHDPLALNDLIVSMLPLVKRVALQFRAHLPGHVELGDLVSAGALGLIDAVRKFDPGRGVAMESYARFRIRGAILDSLRDDDPASRDMRKKLRNIESVCHRLSLRLGRPPAEGEIARAMGLSLADWHATVADLQLLGFEGTGENAYREVRHRVDAEHLADDTAQDPYSLCCRREQRDILNHAMQCLSGRERSILTFYYQKFLTMKQIAARLGIDESRVSQLHSAALLRLRARVRETFQGACHDSSRELKGTRTLSTAEP